MGQQSRPIRVALVGFDDRMRNALRLFFSGPCKNSCVMVEEESAEIGIIDLDAYRGDELCNEYRQRHPNHPLIMISLHQRQIDNAILLRKPLNTGDLVSALADVKRKIEAQAVEQEAENAEQVKAPVTDMGQNIQEIDPDTSHVERKKNFTLSPQTHQAAMYLGDQGTKTIIGTAPDIDPDDPKQLENARYNPDDFLQSHLQRACQTADSLNSCLQIDTVRGSIYVLPGNQAVLLNVSDKHLRTLSVIPIDSSSISSRAIDNGSLRNLESAADTIRVKRESLIWKSALWASRGRVPVGTDLHAPVFMSHWPNLTRLLLFPHAIRIAALWIDQPYSLIDTANTLSIPQRSVFGFFSAAKALGLASTSQRSVDTLVEASSIHMNRRRNLLGRILNRLRLT